MVIALCGCGGTALEKAHKELSELEDSYLTMSYDAEKDELVLKMDSYTNVDAIMDTLDSCIDGKDIGTIVFTMTGTRGDGFETKLDKRIGQLPCSSIECLGLDYNVFSGYSATVHDWTKVLDKVDTLYMIPARVSGDYAGKDLERIGNVKNIKIGYQLEMDFGDLRMLKGAETISLATPYYVEEVVENFDTGGTGTGEVPWSPDDITKADPIIEEGTTETENADEDAVQTVMFIYSTSSSNIEQ